MKKWSSTETRNPDLTLYYGIPILNDHQQLELRRLRRHWCVFGKIAARARSSHVSRILLIRRRKYSLLILASHSLPHAFLKLRRHNSCKINGSTRGIVVLYLYREESMPWSDGSIASRITVEIDSRDKSRNSGVSSIEPSDVFIIRSCGRSTWAGFV